MRYAYRNKRRAVILVLSLWMVLVLSLLAYSLAVEMRVEMKLTHSFRDQFVAEHLSRIGVGRAVADLRNDRLIDYSRNDGKGEIFDANGDVWAGSLTPRKYDVKGVGQYELLVVDEASKLNLNSTDLRSRDQMRYLLMALKVEEKEAQEISDAIWDWKDDDDKPIEAGVEVEETESTYYTNLSHKIAKSRGSSDVVHPKNAKFDTVDELLQIPGMTPQIFYGYNPEKEADPGFFPVPVKGARKKHNPGLRDLVTVRADMLNVNTARIEVLTAVCASVVNDLNAGRSMAEKIVNYRQGGRSGTITNNHALRSLDDLPQAGIQGALASMIAPMLTISSEHFTIYCQAEVGKVSQQQIYSSASSKASDAPLPTSRVVVQVVRNMLIFEPDRFKNQKPPPGCRRAMETRVGLAGLPATDQLQWFVPVVNIERWISE